MSLKSRDRGNLYEIDDGHHGVRRQASGWQHAQWIAKALSVGGTAVIWKDSDPKFMKVYRYGRRIR